MPVEDGRTLGTVRVQPPSKRKLGKRDQPPVDVDTLFHELRDASVQVVARVLSGGGAVQFGSTRDHTAMLVRAWCGGDVYEDYVTSVAEFTATLEALDDVCEGLEHREPARLTKRP